MYVLDQGGSGVRWCNEHPFTLHHPSPVFWGAIIMISTHPWPGFGYMGFSRFRVSPLFWGVETTLVRSAAQTLCFHETNPSDFWRRPQRKTRCFWGAFCAAGAGSYATQVKLTIIDFLPQPLGPLPATAAKYCATGRYISGVRGVEAFGLAKI